MFQLGTATPETRPALSGDRGAAALSSFGAGARLPSVLNPLLASSTHPSNEIPPVNEPVAGVVALSTDRTFTGQKADGTGLLYYNARYYDPALGTFLSPDTIVPDAGMVVDYNRFLYSRANPLKYNDPSGHRPDDGCETESCDSTSNLWLQANGAHSLVDPQWKKEPDEVDAIAVGLGINADTPTVGPVGLALNGGIEFLAHKNGDNALYIYGGPGGSLGSGANLKIYEARIHNLQNAGSYEGPFEVTDTTASVGPIGLTGGRFSTPLDADGAYGTFVGFAPGTDLSISQSVVNYTTPLVNYNSKTNELSFPQFDKFDN